MKDVSKDNKGFTLVELIIVIAIIAILGVTAAPQYVQYVEDARISNDIQYLTSLEQVCNILVADGTLKHGEKVTWNKGGTITYSVASEADDVVDKIEAILPTKAAESEKATDTVVFSIDTSGTKKAVSADTDYRTWDD